MDFLLQLYKSVANERRLRILGVLINGEELCIEEIASQIKIPFATCCRNLKILERVNLVKSSTRNGRVLYRINSKSKYKNNQQIIDMIKRNTEAKTGGKR